MTELLEEFFLTVDAESLAWSRTVVDVVVPKVPAIGLVWAAVLTSLEASLVFGVLMVLPSVRG